MSNNWRISYTDVDSSVAAAPADDTAIKGYMVIEAPKGSSKPLYFQPGSRKKILSLYGSPSSDYPLIQDALDFNDQYSLYLSAPAGTNTTYPSYYGGMYVTDYGPFYFDKVTSKTEPNYLGLLTLGTETRLGDTAATMSRDGSAGTGYTITITGVKATTWAVLKGFKITYTASGQTLSGSVVYCDVNKTSMTVSTLVSGVSQAFGTITLDSGTGIYTFALAGTNAAAPLTNWGTNSSNADLYQDAISFPTGFQVELILDISAKTYFYLAQRSQTEYPTTVKIDKISNTIDVTSTINNAVLTAASHGLVANDTIVFSGSVPAGLTAGAKYYVLDLDLTTNTFKVASSRGGSPIAPTGSGATFSFNDYAFKNNMVQFSVSELAYEGKTFSDGTFTGSLDPTSKSLNGDSDYLPLILPEDGGTMVEAFVVKAFSGNVVTRTALQSYTLTGKRYAAQTTAITANILQEGWDEALSGDYEKVNIFMEPYGDSALKASLVALRRSIHKTSTFIAAINDSTAAAAVISRNASPNSSGVAYYANKLLRDENYTNTQFYSNCIGAIGTKLAAIMDIKKGGWAPHFSDFGGVGGSLPVSARKQLIKWTDDQQQQADKEGLNIIVLDPFQGPMIVGQKTAQSPATLTDYSFLAHTMAFDLFKREITNSVLIPQLGKPIDDKFMNIRQLQAQAILNTRLSGPNKIWIDGKVDAFSFNDDTAKMQNTFKLSVRVKVTRFTEYLELILENVAQETAV